MPTPETVEFADRLSRALGEILGPDLTGLYFVGSIALGGFVPTESDVDMVAVSRSALCESGKHDVASAVIEVSQTCPARGLEFTLHRGDVAGSLPDGADFEVNTNAGRRMTTAVHLDASTEEGFWYIIDRAIAHRSGLVVKGPAPNKVFADVPRRALLTAMADSMTWHRVHEKASLHSVLNACRAWRCADEGVLGSKLAGAEWARASWEDTDMIDAAVALRHGYDATLDAVAVDRFLSAVASRLRDSV